MPGIAAENLSDDLRIKGNELIRIGRDLLNSATLLDPNAPGAAGMLLNEGEILVLAKAQFDDRKSRSRYFRSDIFGEPAWAILLDLFIQQQVGKRVSVTAACIGSGVPTSSALRRLSLLVDEGLVEREGDPKDGRRSWLRLTPKATESMVEYLRTGTYLGRLTMAATAPIVS
ncbi:MAG: winged helix DNA-binding protein [Novosphingobium sp.]|nr:winged helix DNA-binding protein [Novosphingobium sp.]